MTQRRRERERKGAIHYATRCLLLSSRCRWLTRHIHRQILRSQRHHSAQPVGASPSERTLYRITAEQYKGKQTWPLGECVLAAAIEAYVVSLSLSQCVCPFNSTAKNHLDPLDLLSFCSGAVESRERLSVNTEKRSKKQQAKQATAPRKVEVARKSLLDHLAEAVVRFENQSFGLGLQYCMPVIGQSFEQCSSTVF